MIFSILCFGGAMFLIFMEYTASRKKKTIEEIRQKIHTPIINSNVKEAVTMGAVGAGLSLFDIYATTGKHAEVLDVLEQRFPNAHGANDMWDWFQNISNILEDNASSLETYVSCFKGQAAENIAVQLLQDRGLDAELFDSLTNETNDIFVEMQDGTEKYFSVKCGDTSYVKQCIEESDATSFIINSESYSDLESKGLIDYYERNGIEIIDGNYSDAELTDIAENAFEEIGDAGDVSDSIPYVALAFLGIKTYRNIKDYSLGKQTANELIPNIGMDVLKIGTAGVFASIGSEVGASIGTMIFPGVGTVIGAGIGILGGALFSSSIFEWAKEQIKWGKIIAAQEYFGKRFRNGFDAGFCSNIVDKVLNTGNLKLTMQEEKCICDKYEDELNPYSIKKVSTSAVLAQEYFQSLEIMDKRVQHTKESLGREAIRICKSSVSKLNENKQDKFFVRLLGELIIGNSDSLPVVSTEENALLSDYYQQSSLASNYPYQFSESPKVVMENLIKQIFNSYQPHKTIQVEKNGLRICAIVLLIIIGLISL